MTVRHKGGGESEGDRVRVGVTVRDKGGGGGEGVGQ